MFVQLSIGMDGIHLDDGELISADLIPLGLANQRRGHADMSSKVCASCYMYALHAQCLPKVVDYHFMSSAVSACR